MASIEFWYEFGSTYSYPAALRIERLAEEVGVEVRWRPFLLGPIFQTLGWTDSPFNIFAAKGRYMWRDLERVCEAEGLPLRLPPVKFPQNGLKAARIALVGEGEDWTPSFTRAVFAANYAEQKDISEDATFPPFLAHSASMRRRHLPRRIRPRTRTRSGVRPRRLRHAGCLARRASPSATSCSGAMIVLKPHSPGLPPSPKTSHARPCAGHRRISRRTVRRGWPDKPAMMSTESGDRECAGARTLLHARTF
jgi:2-hydroxychromene-2-carboxylate isomerase